MKQNNSTELLGHSFHEYTRNGLPDPQDTESTFFPGFPGFSMGNLYFWASPVHNPSLHPEHAIRGSTPSTHRDTALRIRTDPEDIPKHAKKNVKNLHVWHFPLKYLPDSVIFGLHLLISTLEVFINIIFGCLIALSICCIVCR